jgi:hypothetical protein
MATRIEQLEEMLGELITDYADHTTAYDACMCEVYCTSRTLIAKAQAVLADKTEAGNKKYVVIATRIPTNFNDPISIRVEAPNEDDARNVGQRHLNDLAGMSNYDYVVREEMDRDNPQGKVTG